MLKAYVHPTDMVERGSDEVIIIIEIQERIIECQRPMFTQKTLRAGLRCCFEKVPAF